MSIKISAVICTHNRAGYLKMAMQSLIRQTLPKDQYEIIVVDNASTDGTRQVLGSRYQVSGSRCQVLGDRYKDRSETSNLKPSTYNLKYIYEPILGLSQARNTGWKNAQGEYVAYLDDDAVSAPDWLEKIIKAFESINPQPGCIGGKVEPVWEAPRPAWLADKLLGQLAIVDWGDQPRLITKEEWLAGANIAYPKRLLEEIGGFSVKLGRIGNKLLSMEENLMRLELEKRNYKLYYDANIAVKHHIPASRLTKKWLLKRSYWNGVSGAIVNIEQNQLAMPRRFYRGLLTLLKIFFSFKWLILADFKTKCAIYGSGGYIMAMWSLVR
jgi:glycosyltransferase involved in cell wall biosynthesis